MATVPSRSSRWIGVFLRVAVLLGLAWIGWSGFIHFSNRLPPEIGDVLQNADTATLYSLDPNVVPRSAGGMQGPLLRGHKVLGSVNLDHGKTIIAAAAFRSAVRNWQGSIDACFNPRHALRTVANGHTYDFILCYECKQMEVYRDNANVASVGVGGSPDALDSLLAAAQVPLAPLGIR